MGDSYAIIRLGNKQHRVYDGETLVVDRLSTEPGQSFEPCVLLGDRTVTATVIAHERGPKIRIGKYRRRTGYKRHNGHRSATSRVQISLGARSKGSAAPKETAKAEAEAPAPAPAPAGVPSGYEELTVAGTKAASADWTEPETPATLAHQ